MRELQSAARRRGIYRSRYMAGICALAGGAFALFWSAYLPGKTPPGLALFWFLSAVAAILCFAAGFLLTCDSISREKREGTLGLLFLTSLGLHEIVLGKLAASIVFWCLWRACAYSNSGSFRLPRRGDWASVLVDGFGAD